MATAIITAAGAYKRWDRPYPKQLACISGEFILPRIVKYAHRYCSKVYVMTHDDIIKRAVSGSCTVVHPEKHECLLETIHSSIELWEDRVFIILGDVYFTNASIDAVFQDNGVLRFFGNMGELFGMAFDPIKQQIVEQALQSSLLDYEGNPHDGSGKLWQLYRTLCGFPLHEQRLDGELLHSIEDGITDDVDTMFDYLRLCSKLECKPDMQGDFQ